jgi:hypothetical protein
MFARLAADLLVVLHLAFILFVIFGALLAFRWRWIILLHIPAAVWGALIEFQDWTCPLTPWENHFRELAGEEGFSEGFIEHYLLSVIYPEGLTRNVQFVLGTAVLLINLGLYGWLIVRGRSNQSETPAHDSASR